MSSKPILTHNAMAHEHSGYAELQRENARLREENDKLKRELIEELGMAMRQGCHRGMDGWYDTVAISTWRDIGERLVELGVWEREGELVGRRGFYRPLKGGGDE